MIVRGIAAIALGSLVVCTFAAPAGAAVSVIGTGIAQTCYQAAEYGGNLEDGIASCTTALNETALSPHDRAATLVNRGILRAQNSDSKGALDDYNQGLGLDDALGEAYVDRGAAEIVLKNFDAALADINKGIALNANKPQIAYYDRAVVDEALGNIKDAYADYKKAVELEPDFTLANAQLMRFRVVHKHPDGA